MITFEFIFWKQKSKLTVIIIYTMLKIEIPLTEWSIIQIIVTQSFHLDRTCTQDVRQHHCITSLSWTPKGKRKTGRPKIMRQRTVERERNAASWKSWFEAQLQRADKGKSVKTLYATEHEEEVRCGEVNLSFTKIPINYIGKEMT